MLEVTFDIPTIKKLEPKLYEHFGFTLDDILYELTQVYIRKSTNLTPEEKEIAKQCKTENGATDAIKFALAIKENIHIRVTETFPDSLKLLLDLFNEYNITELKDGDVKRKWKCQYGISIFFQSYFSVFIHFLARIQITMVMTISGSVFPSGISTFIRIR